MIKIFAVCKSDVFISVVRPLLSKCNINVLGICTNSENAVEEFLNCKPKPNILLLDANWGNSTIPAETILHNILDIEPVKTIITATFYDEEHVEKFREASGFFYRNQSLNEIVNCIFDVFNRER